MEKRYQYYTKDGIVWSEWMKWDSEICPKYQLKSHPTLLNEYRDK